METFYHLRYVGPWQWALHRAPSATLPRLISYMGEHHDVCPVDAIHWLLSERLVEALKSETVTGLAFLDLPVSPGWLRSPIQRTSLVVTGRCGAPTWSAAPKESVRGLLSSVHIQSLYASLPLDVATWDGSDMFRPNGTALILLVPRIVSLLDRLAVRYWRAEPLVTTRVSFADVRRWESMSL